MPAIAPEDMSRATEFAFTDWLGDALLVDFAVSDLWLTGAELDKVGPVAAAAWLEDIPELVVATSGVPLVELRDALERSKHTWNGCLLRR
jgi:hypothetical protein